jgi:hypothetical protein
VRLVRLDLHHAAEVNAGIFIVYVNARLVDDLAF